LEVYFQNTAMAADGIVWHLRYRAASASAYKWEFVGGSPLWSEVTANETLGTTYNAYTALATAGPALTLPVAGDYMVGIGAEMYSAGTTFPNVLVMSYDIGATAASDADGVGAGATPVNVRFAGFRERRKTAMAGVTLTAKYKQNNDQGRWLNRWMRATPVRVG
jgi:hypothetical protein